MDQENIDRGVLTNVFFLLFLVISEFHRGTYELPKEAIVQLLLEGVGGWGPYQYL